MMKKTNYIIFIITICILLVGCENKHRTYLVPVQEYTGKEYLAKDKEQWDYVEEHKEIFEEYAIKWFKEKYQLDVKVNFTYPHIETETVISTVEWIEDSDLKMCIVMGVDKTKHEVMGVNETVMQVDYTIMAYLTHRMYEKEFYKLEKFLKEFATKYDLLGVNDEYLKNTGGFVAYNSTYYVMGSSSTDYEEILQMFIEDKNVSMKKLRKAYEKKKKELEEELQKELIYIDVNVRLYSKTNEINEELFQILEKDFLAQEGFPDVNYVFTLCENGINVEYGKAKEIDYPEYPSATGYIRIDGEYR